jgi:hypothetical protein
MTKSVFHENYCVVISVKGINNPEITKWRWYALAVTVLGIILYAMPWLPDKVKFLLAIPLYALFVYVYYKYICLKKAAQALASPKEDSSESQKISSAENANKNVNQPGKKTGKKGK